MTEDLPPTGEDIVQAPPRPAMEPFRGQGPATLVVALGGAIGALARWAVGLGLPTLPGAFPLGTFLINVAGCAAIGVVLVALTELRQAHPLWRPFLATGILGGFTTFSTFSVDSQHLLLGGHLALGLLYLAGTLGAAVAATWFGAAVTRRLGR
ncbi:fluoride efflux transporter CrcB [Pseudonocardia sp. RS11V-5]|uniref:fluoride efflux transporter CrcB n=1 Tax=Pseudonocardia terrae TaxID=2905831 RepID=UPI001E412FA0|nr:fluoride efflux transporter CrcB [Pseudonocardia terrae]MCE3554012.1 fluoride efflux transporter CrcB [Pseudonocardia terrae]